MRVRCLIATLAALLLIAPAAASAKGAHGEAWEGEECPTFTTEDRFHAIDDAITSTIHLVADGLYDLSDRLDSVAFKQTASLTLFAAEIADFGVSSHNMLAEATCYTPRHWILEDELMKMTVQANLAVTSAPDVSFVMPEVKPSGHVPPKRKDPAGFIDRVREGGDNPNDVDAADIVGVVTTVRDVIDQMKDAGQCSCGSAESAYASAVSAMGAGQYKNAYRLFRQAYVNAVSG